MLAEELHFGRAASRLAITQPPLSSSIRLLEEELGVRLFDRDKKTVKITAAGKALYPEACQLLEGLKRAFEITASVAKGFSGEVRIGYSTSMLYRGLPKILDAYQQAYPDVSVALYESNAAQIIDSLRHRNLDAAFVNAERVPDGLTGHIFSREPFVCAMPSDHRLAKSRTLKMSQLRDEKFIMFKREAHPANFDNVMGVCRSGGFEPKVGYSATHWMNVVALVGNGFGISIVPKSMANCGIANTVFVPFEDGIGWCASSFIWNADHVSPALLPLLKITYQLSPANANDDSRHA